MGEPKKIEFASPWGGSGIQITYVKSSKTLRFFGWYDSSVGIEGGSMSLQDFCEQLGIDLSTRRG